MCGFLGKIDQSFQYIEGWSYNTVDRVPALHLSNNGLVSGTTYGS